ncbi:MAG: NADPH-dependent FMN reductase [Bdellovibrio sp.]
MKVVGICGSLRKSSSNYAILKLVQTFFGENIYNEINLAEFPFFDPDQQFSNETPKAVLNARKLASESDVIIVSTPEYAHGVPGILKNGFEWLFHEGTQRKKVAVIIGAAQGEHTQAQLLEILKTMDFDISLKNILIIKGLRSKLTDDGNFQNESDKIDFIKFLQQLL